MIKSICSCKGTRRGIGMLDSISVLTYLRGIQEQERIIINLKASATIETKLIKMVVCGMENNKLKALVRAQFMR